MVWEFNAVCAQSKSVLNKFASLVAHICFIDNAFNNMQKSKYRINAFPCIVLSKIASFSFQINRYYSIYQENKDKNMNSSIFKVMCRLIKEIQVGVLLRGVLLSFLLMKFSITIDVLHVLNTIVSDVNARCILIWIANNIKVLRISLRQTKALWCLLKEPSLNSVLIVNFGLKRTKDAIIWHADVSINFAIFVVANMEAVHVSA